MSSLETLRNLVFEALTCVSDGYRAPPTKTSLQKWCSKMQKLFIDIEKEKERLKQKNFPVPAMPQCTHLIELGLCVATKEFGFAKLRRSLEHMEQKFSIRELMRSELPVGKGSYGLLTHNHNHKRARDVENRDEPSGREKRKRNRANHAESESEDEFSVSTAEDEQITKALVLRKDNPCDRCLKSNATDSCYLRPLKSGGIAINCFRCHSLRQRCVTNTKHVHWQLISGRYIGIAEHIGRSGKQRQQFYYEKAPAVAFKASRTAAPRNIPLPHTEIVPQNDQPQQPSTSQFRITVETSTVPQAQPENNALILRPRSHYPLTPPLENRPSDFQQSHFSLSPTPSAFISSNSHTGNQQDARALNTIAYRLHNLQASFARVEDKVHILVNKGAFSPRAGPGGLNINVQLLELDIGETLGDKLAQLEHGSQKFESAFLETLSRSRRTSQASTPTQTKSTQTTSSQTNSSRNSPEAADLLKAMKDILGRLQRKAELSSTYLQVARLVDPDVEGRNVKICQDAKEDVKELSWRLRRLCAQLKESLAPAE